MLADVDAYALVKTLHVISIVLAFGVTFAYPLIFPFLHRTSPEAVAPLHEAQERVGKFLITPAMVVALITGIYLAVDAEVFDELWVQVPFGILIVLFGLGGGFFAPTERRLAGMARTDPAGADYQALLGRLKTVSIVASVLILVAIYFMVAKPGA